MTDQMDLLEALRQREHGMEQVLERKSPYRLSVESAIGYLASTGCEFSSDDVRGLCGDPPPGVSANLTGALFNAAARSGLIHKTGYTISARVIGHGNLLRTWSG